MQLGEHVEISPFSTDLFHPCINPQPQLTVIVNEESTMEYFHPPWQKQENGPSYMPNRY